MFQLPSYNIGQPLNSQEISQYFIYSPEWPYYSPTLTNYRDFAYIWHDLLALQLQTKFNTTHIYYDTLIQFLRKKCDKRSKQQIKDKRYIFNWASLSLADMQKFQDYDREFKITLCRLKGQGIRSVILNIDARDYKVNEAEISTVTLRILAPYFWYNEGQKAFWSIAPQARDTTTNKTPDFYILGKIQGQDYTKFSIELKTYRGDSLKKND